MIANTHLIPVDRLWEMPAVDVMEMLADGLEYGERFLGWTKAK